MEEREKDKILHEMAMSLPPTRLGKAVLDDLADVLNPLVGKELNAHDAEEKSRCAEIALNMWKKKPAKDAEWYKTVGREIAAEIMGIGEKLLNFGFSEKEAASHAIKLTQMAADVAEFRDLKEGEAKFIGPFGISVVLDETLEEDEWHLLCPPP